jgi:hypothetical protein
MNHDRSDSIPLAADVARCEPAKPCTARGTCARYQAAIPRHRAVLADYSVDGGGVLCAGYINAASVRKAPQPVTRRVHPAVGGL